MILDSFGLVASFVVLAVLLALLLLYTNWPWLVKGAMIVAVSGFFYVTYHSIPQFFGWPTAHHMPEKLRLVAIYIDAPNKIFLWGHDMAYGVAGQRPRAYEMVYTTKLNDSLNKAAHKLKKGFPMMAEIRPIASSVAQKSDGEIKEVDEFDLLIFDVPEGLAPSGEK